jgi:adenylate cyclase
MSQQIEKLAIMFADVCDSTSLYERVGDIKAQHLIAWCIHTLLQEIAPFQGILIKTIGDEIMCTFPDAKSAFNAACAMQNAMQNKHPEQGETMHIRIGFHYGEVICEAGDVFGDTVNVAARVASLARAEQIMTTLAAQEALPLSLRNRTHQCMTAELKGKHEKYPIFLVVWEQDDTEHTRFNALPQNRTIKRICELTLRYQGRVFKVNEQHDSLLLGRSDDCDIVIQNSFVSRRHVRVECRFGKFMLVDQSTNGTFVRPSTGHISHVMRGEFLLQDFGDFTLGQSNFQDANELIKFSIVCTVS